MKYAIITDSSANLTNELIDENQVGVVSLSYYAEGKEYQSYEPGKGENLKNFYEMLQKRTAITTSSANVEDFLGLFETTLKDGYDILYIGFSGALSNTYFACEKALASLKDKYPERKTYAVNSLCASLGEGKLVVLAAENRKNGMSIEDNYNFCEQTKLKIVHCFTVDDLFFLYRGGRVSRTAYYAGTIAQIKPVMHMDNEGRLVPVGKVMGRKRSLKAICDMFCDLIEKPEEQVIYITHGN